VHYQVPPVAPSAREHLLLFEKVHGRGPCNYYHIILEQPPVDPVLHRPPPFVTIASFLLEDTFVVPVLIIFGVCALMLLLSFFFFKGIEKKWAGESFLF